MGLICFNFFLKMFCVALAYPFFNIDPTKYPSEEKRRLFCALYLSRLTGKTVKVSHKNRLDPTLDAIERFQLATHMLWAFWSVIRAPQAVTATQFDMIFYAQKRFVLIMLYTAVAKTFFFPVSRIDCYWTQKAHLIAQGKLVP